MPTSRSPVARTMARLRRALTAIESGAALPEDVMRRRAQLVLDELARIPAAILVANERGRFVDVNDRASLLTGYSRTELLRLSVWDLTPDTRQALGRRLWRDFLRRGRLAGLYQVRRKSGETIRARYVAVANVLPVVHVSALAAPQPRRRISTRTRSRR